MYRIHEIKLGTGESKSAIPGKIRKKLNVEVLDYKIVKESIDARDKSDIKYIYTVDFKVAVEFEGVLSEAGIEKVSDTSYEYPPRFMGTLRTRPVIAGFGPCGMFAALLLSESGYAPIVLERGKPVNEREKDIKLLWNEDTLNEESNVQFGEGGAGTFSDGKLTTGIKDGRIRKVLEELVNAGAGEDILYKQKPHIGTDVLKKVVKSIREKIISNGGEILFETRLEDVVIKDNKLIGVKVCDKEGQREISAEHLIVATGHSARDTVRALHDAGILMEQKPFSIGIRIEHFQKLIDESQYGKNADKRLPPAEYKLSHRCENGRGVYTFCMCPGGEVIMAASHTGGIVTNGMSNSARSGKFANSAVLVDVRTSDFNSDDPLAGLLFQEKYEKIAFENAGKRYKALQTTWAEFENGSPSALPVIESLPDFAISGIKEAIPKFARKIKNFDDPTAKIYAVESRSSSPVRITRDENFQSNIAGIYPGGEGAGYSGGIMSSAVDGIKIAEEIVKKLLSE